MATTTTEGTTESTVATTTTEGTTESTVATTTTEETTTTKSSEGFEDLEGLKATWTIGVAVAHAGDENVKLPVTVSGDPGLNSFIFSVNAADGLTFSKYAQGNAYDLLTMAVEYPKFSATSEDETITNVQAAEDATVVDLYFNVGADVAPGIYPVTFDGDVQALRISTKAIDVTEIDGYIEVLAPDDEPVVSGYRYVIRGNDKFYLSHDPRAFSAADLISSLRRQEILTKADGTQTYGTLESIDPSTLNITMVPTGSDLTSPKAYYDNAGTPYCVVPMSAIITDEVNGEQKVTTVEVEGATAYIGVKGDTDLNGTCLAPDASEVLIYATEKGVGRGPKLFNADREWLPESLKLPWSETLENFVYFLSDVTNESEDGGSTDPNGGGKTDVDANDASLQLVYAAICGTKGIPNTSWAYDVLDGAVDPMPYYTALIEGYNK